MKKNDFDYYLPPELIAQQPIEKRDQSRLMVVKKNVGTVAHRFFTDIIDYLDRGDCLVLNDTKVLPARLYGTKLETGAKIEFVLLRQTENQLWEVMVRPGRRARIGSVFTFGEGRLIGTIVDRRPDGTRRVKFEHEGSLESVLEHIGQLPLPPYIQAEVPDTSRYQTVYAQNTGSAAAPTAGLHFTPQLLQAIADRGVHIVPITLHIGLGTFRPVKAEQIKDHIMHYESFELNRQAGERINDAKERGHRIVCVGTTCCRTVEACADEQGYVQPQRGQTDLFIYPGYRFRVLDRLITNFHLPQSTLLMLVSALAGRDVILDAYRCAISEKYRFYSFGDAMLIL